MGSFLPTLVQRCPVFAEVKQTSAHFTGDSICLAYSTACDGQGRLRDVYETYQTGGWIQ